MINQGLLRVAGFTVTSGSSFSTCVRSVRAKGSMHFACLSVPCLDLLPLSMLQFFPFAFWNPCSLRQVFVVETELSVPQPFLPFPWVATSCFFCNCFCSITGGRFLSCYQCWPWSAPCSQLSSNCFLVVLSLWLHNFLLLFIRDLLIFVPS